MFTKNNIDYRNSELRQKDKDNLEEFTLKNLETINLKSEEHVKTKSLILAPFNTSAGENEYLNSEIDLENNQIKYNGKVRELNKNYELNNNGEIDTGMIISPSGNTFNSLKNESFNEGSGDLGNNKLRSDMIMSLRNSGLCSPNPEEVNKLNFGNKSSLASPKSKIISVNNNGVVFNINEDVLNLVVGIGYSANFVVKSIVSNEVNYATASYYLLLKDFQ